jgi:hypothetical protein
MARKDEARQSWFGTRRLVVFRCGKAGATRLGLIRFDLARQAGIAPEWHGMDGRGQAGLARQAAVRPGKDWHGPARQAWHGGLGRLND